MPTPPPPSPFDEVNQAFDEFKAYFFDEMGLNDLPVDEKNKRWEEIEEIIMGRVFLRLEDNFTPELREAWKQCATEEDMNEFFEKNDIPIVDLIMNEASLYREEMVANMAYVHGKLEIQPVKND